MNLNKIGMILADTSRSKYYLKALIKNKLIPNYVLILLNLSNTIIAGQKKITSKKEIINLLKSANINYETTINDNINNNNVIKLIKNRSEKVFIFSGYGGALLKEKILNIGKKFLHVHGGYLPDFKGSTTNYYSLLVENTMGASSIFLNEEIDCGPIIFREKFPEPNNKLNIDYMYDSGARAKVLVKTINDFIKFGTWKFELSDNLGGETYYIIHPVLKHIAILAKK